MYGIMRPGKAVYDCAILPIQGISGICKDRFIDWWRLHSAQSKRLPETMRVVPEDIVQIELEPSPPSTIPMCVAFWMLWFQLRVLDARLRGMPIESPTRRLRSFSTQQHFLSLY